jgi:hypothetical protein
VLVGVALALWIAPSAHAGAARNRILYAGDWSGNTEKTAPTP